MKNNKICLLALAAVCGVSVALTGCDNAEYGALTHKVYFAEAATSSSKSISMEESGATSSVTMRLDQPTDGDVMITLETDATLIEEYNKINQTEVKPLPAEYYEMPGNIVIKAGKISSDPAQVVVKPFAATDRFAIPLKIKSVEGPASAAGASGSFLLLVDKPLVVSCPILTGKTGGNIATGPFDENGVAIKWGLLVNSWSVELWTKMSNWNQNQGLFGCWSSNGDEIYIRFGDAGAPFNWLQIKTMGTQADTPKNFVANKWYHIAITYDGVQVLIYVDGVVAAAKATKGGPILIDQWGIVSGGASYFIHNCYMSEVRLWKKALTPTQIRNNRFYEINPQNPDLIAYWKMNEGSGYALKDYTGNGHDGKEGVAGKNAIQGWATGQRFDQ